MADASFLPTEILIQIFHYLEVHDILAARLCCKEWFHIGNRPEFVSKRILKITGGVLDSKHPAAKVISASRIENLYLKDIQFGDVNELFGQIGDNLKALTLKSMPISQDRLLTLTHFTNLQSLKVCRIRWSPTLITDVDYLQFCGLSRLKVLELAKNEPCLDKYLLDCSMCASCLEKLTLESTEDLEDEVLKILDKQAETLKFLDLYFHKPIAIANISQWKRIASKLSLKELSLGGDFSRDIVVEMIKNQKSLRFLLIRGSNVDDGHLTLIVQELPQLERLLLDSCYDVTDIGVGQLAKLSKLNVLGLQYGNLITSDGIRSIIDQEASTRLQELYLQSFRYLDEDLVCYFAQNLQHLRVFGLSGCDRAVTNKSVQQIFEYQRNLRELRLGECEKLTDFGMLGHNSIRKLEELEWLSLCGCKRLSDETLCGISAPRLKFLDIRGCIRMTSRGISALVKNCPTIEKIAFNYEEEEAMNEEDDDVLTKGLSRLRTLNIEGYSKVQGRWSKKWKRKPFYRV